MKTLLENDIFKPASKEEAEARKLAYRGIKIKEIAEVLKTIGTLNPDGTLDIQGDVDITSLGLTSIGELGIKFGKVGRYFSCSGNQLTTLEGAPTSVGGNFYCSSNKLTTLEGAPTRVGRSFSCSRNRLTSLEGAPKEVGRSFYCYRNSVKFTEDQVREVCKVEGDIVV